MSGKQHCASRVQLPAGATHEAAHMPFALPILLVSGAQAPEQHAAAVVHSAPLVAHEGLLSGAPASGGGLAQAALHWTACPQLFVTMTPPQRPAQGSVGVQQEPACVHSWPWGQAAVPLTPQLTFSPQLLVACPHSRLAHVFATASGVQAQAWLTHVSPAGHGPQSTAPSLVAAPSGPSLVDASSGAMGRDSGTETLGLVASSSVASANAESASTDSVTSSASKGPPSRS
jgi:hypothetical protein